jgi:hypothetical protein
MKCSAEISIDIDANRKIWITGTAEGVEPGDVAQVQEALQEQVTVQGLAAYNHVTPQPMTAEQVVEAARAASTTDPADRRPREDDPATMRTFGDDD